MNWMLRSSCGVDCAGGWAPCCCTCAGAPPPPSSIDRMVSGVIRLIAAQLPTVFGGAIPVLRELLSRHRPALVVACGQAGGRSAISLERVAINVDDARIPDNAGMQPVDTPVIAGGPAAYFSTLPI